MDEISQTKADQPRNRDGPNDGRDTYAVSSASASVTLRVASRIPILRWVASLGRGIARDLRARTPFYKSDWTDAWNYRVVPATALIFCAKYALRFFTYMSRHAELVYVTVFFPELLSH